MKRLLVLLTTIAALLVLMNVASAQEATTTRFDKEVTNGHITHADTDKCLEPFQQRLTKRSNKFGGVEATPEAIAAA